MYLVSIAAPTTEYSDNNYLGTRPQVTLSHTLLIRLLCRLETYFLSFRDPVVANAQMSRHGRLPL